FALDGVLERELELSREARLAGDDQVAERRELEQPALDFLARKALSGACDRELLGDDRACPEHAADDRRVLQNAKVSWPQRKHARLGASGDGARRDRGQLTDVQSERRRLPDTARAAKDAGRLEGGERLVQQAGISLGEGRTERDELVR